MVVDTLLGVGSPLVPGPRLHRFTHAGSFEAALEANEKVSVLLFLSVIIIIISITIIISRLPLFWMFTEI